jgi:multiple sugar transport system ATP-binding protein
VIEGEGGTRLTGKADVVEQLGESHLLHLDMPDGQRVIVRHNGDAKAREGHNVEIGIDGNECHLFLQDGLAAERLI